MAKARGKSVQHTSAGVFGHADQRRDWHWWLSVQVTLRMA
jgi:hypothetical protein